MGDARHNPRSPQYQGELPGMIPRHDIEARIMPNVVTMERLRQLQEAAGAGVEIPFTPTPDDLDYVVVLRGCWVAPTKLSDRWPQANVDLLELHRMPLAEFKRRAAEAFMNAGAPDFTRQMDLAGPKAE